MVSTNHQILKHFFDAYSSNPALHLLKDQLEKKTSTHSTPDGIDDIVKIYESSIRIIGKDIWSAGPDEALINMYQSLFQELEDLIALKDTDNRHKFVIVIPVADRPRHLQSCLQSLLTLCQSFHYGGYCNQTIPQGRLSSSRMTPKSRSISRNTGNLTPLQCAGHRNALFRAGRTTATA